MKCDKDGVPLLIQDIFYDRLYMLFHVRLFNTDKIHKFIACCACSSIGLFDMPDKMQMLQAENWIHNHVLDNWEKYTC